MKRDNDYLGQIDECVFCNDEVFVDSPAEEYKYIDGIGLLCSACMGLDKFSSMDEEIDLKGMVIEDE